MLSFGKKSTGRRGLIGTRRFDTMIAAPRVTDVMVTSGRMVQTDRPELPAFEPMVVLLDWTDDMTAITAPLAHGTLRLNRHINARLAHEEKVRKWRPGMPNVEMKVNPLPLNLGHVCEEPNLDGEAKLSRYHSRDKRRSQSKKADSGRTRNGQTWKSHGEKVFKVIYFKQDELNDVDHKTEYSAWHAEADHHKVRKQYNAHMDLPPHIEWSIGEETSATFLVWDREDDEDRVEQAKQDAINEDRSNHIEWCHEEELRELARLDKLYEKGQFCDSARPLIPIEESDAKLDEIDAWERHFDKAA